MKNKKLLFFIIIISSFVIFTYCVFKNFSSDRYNSLDLWLLPLAFILIEIVFCSDWNKFTKSYGVITFEIVAFIRYVVLVLSYYNTDNSKFIENKDMVIFLMIIELVLCRIVIHFKAKERKKEIKIITNKNKNIIILGFSAIFIMIAIMVPSLINKITWINTSETINVDVIILLLYGFSSIIFSLLIFSLIKNSKMIKNNIIKIILSMCLAFFFAINTSVSPNGNISRWTLIVYLITIFIILSYLYVDNRRFLKYSSLICMIVVLIVSTFFKTNKKTLNDDYKNEFDSGEVVNSNLSYGVLDAYFSGPYQVSKAIGARNSFKSNISFTTMICDVFANCPKVNKLFDEKNVTPYYYNYQYYGHDKYSDKICPMVGQGYMYFGIFFAPLLSIIVTYFCVVISNKIEGEIDIYKFYLLVFASIYFGLFMCINMNIVMQSIWIKLLPLFLIYLLSKKININI